MSRSALAIVTLAVVLSGCVSVAAPTASPPEATPTLPVTTMAPTLEPTDAPTATPTLEPTDAPTATPTLEPTDAPTATATLGPTDAPVSPEPGDFPFDERDLQFHDTFDDPASGWGQGEVTAGDGSRIGTIAYAAGALELTVDTSGAWLWTRRETGAANGTIRLAGEFVPGSEGGFGLLCGSGQEDLFGAVVFTSGAWALVSIADGAVEELESDAAAGLDVPIGESTGLAVECAGTATGMLRMQMWLDGTGPIAIYESAQGPASFDRAAIYAEAASDAYQVRLEEMLAFGVTGPDGQLNADGQELLSHVPEDWQSSCYQSPVPPIFGAMATANLACFIGSPGDAGAEVAEYAAYSSKEDMDTAYQNRVDNFGTGDSPSCTEGPGERGYNIGGADVGRVLCADQVVGIRFDWTDDRLNILASLVDFDGSYSATFDNWASGGPNL